jgi:hypothetical protein
MAEQEIRPSLRKDDPEARSGTLNSNPLRPKFQLPKKHEVKDPDLLAWITGLLDLRPVVDSELLEIREQLEGGRKAISSKYFPKPNPTMSDTLWQQNRKLLHHVNLMQPVQNAYVNSVYSNEVVRTAEENPYKEWVQEWLESDDLAQTMEDWAGNKVAFGRSVAVAGYETEADEGFVWLPDPVYTRVFLDPMNKDRIIAVAEITRTRIQFIHLKGEGVLTENAYDFENRDFGWLPVVVGYGRDLRSSGSANGLPMLRDALSATTAATSVMYNVRLLQKQETKNILVRIADLDELKKREAGRPVSSGDQTVMDLPKDSKAEILSRNPNIDPSLNVLRQQISLLATAGGVPADVLDPTLTESSSSAEAARIRAIPMLQGSKRLVRQWRRDERQLTLAMTAVKQYYKNKQKPIKIAELKKKVSTFIGMTPAGLPQSPNEETQDIISKVAFGLMTPEDGVRALNGTKTAAEVNKMADTIRKNMEDAGGGAALEQQVNGGGRPPKAQPKPAPAAA